MARIAKLTKRIVEGAPLRARPYFIWCGELRGFAVRILPTGRRFYYASFGTARHDRHRLSIGEHGKLTTDEARQMAIVMFADAIKGGDPALDRSTRRTSMTMSDLCDRYLTAAGRGLVLGKKGGAKKSSTLIRDRSRIERHIIPLLGKKKVMDLTRTDITRFMRDVAAGKTAKIEKTSKLRGKAIVEGGPGAAARTVGLLGGILSFAVSEGVVEVNPVHGVKRPADQRRTARLVPETYRRLGVELERMSIDGDIPMSVTAIQLLCLTGCRKGEIERLRWSEIDTAGGMFRLGDTKEGASTRPIGSRAFAVLSRLAQRRPEDFVCHGRNAAQPYGGLPGAWTRIAKAADLPGITLHTLRHSFASVAADLGYSEATIGAMLGHSSGTITGRYIHHLDDVLIAAASRVSETIWTYMTGIGRRDTPESHTHA